MDKAHLIEQVSISGTLLHLRVDGVEYDIDLASQSKRLANATPDQISDFAVSPSGYGIHWPRLDEDLSIDRLIGVRHSFPEAETTA